MDNQDDPTADVNPDDCTNAAGEGTPPKDTDEPGKGGGDEEAEAGEETAQEDGGEEEGPDEGEDEDKAPGDRGEEKAEETPNDRTAEEKGGEDVGEGDEEPHADPLEEPDDPEPWAGEPDDDDVDPESALSVLSDLLKEIRNALRKLLRGQTMEFGDFTVESDITAKEVNVNLKLFDELNLHITLDHQFIIKECFGKGKPGDND